MLMDKVFWFAFVMMQKVLPQLCEVVTSTEFLKETLVTNAATYTERGV